MISTKPKKSPLLSPRNFLSAALYASLMTAVGAARSEEPSSGTKASPSPAAVDCSKSTMTGDTLIEAFHTLVTHGDLTDIPFVEKTLQVKFRPREDTSPPANRNPQILTILNQADSAWNLPISIRYDVRTFDPAHGRRLALILIPDGSNQTGDDIVEQCLKISPKKLSDSFGGNFVLSPMGGGDINASKTVGNPDKYGNHFGIVYHYGDKHPMAHGLGIVQD